jgi:integrase
VQKNELGDVLWGAVGAKSRMKHLKWLEFLRPICTWRDLVVAMERLRTVRNWRFSTTSTALGEVLGAIKRSQMYGIPCRLIGKSPVIDDYRKGLQLGMITELETLKQATPLTVENVRRIVQKNLIKDQEVATYISLMWATAARPGCIEKLKVKNVSVENLSLKCLFTEGKGVRCRRRPYTIHSSLSMVAVRAVQNWLEQRKSLYLFNQHDSTLRKRVLQAIRVQVKDATLYSMRRGAALALMKGGATLTEVQNFLGHTSSETTERYLGWGWEDRNQASINAQRAKALW